MASSPHSVDTPASVEQVPNLPERGAKPPRKNGACNECKQQKVQAGFLFCCEEISPSSRMADGKPLSYDAT